MSELMEKLDNEEAGRILKESLPKPASEPVKIETDGVFNQDYLDQSDPDFLNEMHGLLGNPMQPLISMLSKSFEKYFESIESVRPRPLEFPKSEHKVKIFRLNDHADLTQIESAIEEYLNEGWCCHHPTICGDFILMDFSRRVEGAV